MSQSTIRKAIGAVKDQTSISIAKVSGNIAPDLEVLVVKATSHDEDPSDEKYIREIVNLSSSSRGYVSACVITISKRLRKTSDWIVAVKSLMLVHRVLVDGHISFQEEIMQSTRKGMRILNLNHFKDEAHSNSWDHASFVRFYAMYLDEKVEFIVFEKKLRGSDGNLSKFEGKEMTPLRAMRPERVLEKLKQLIRVLDRVLACRPAGLAKSSRLVIVAVYPVVKESFRVYQEVCEVLGVLFDWFIKMEYEDCVRAFNAYVNAAKMIDELVGFYDLCKDVGIARSSEYPEVQRITGDHLRMLEDLLKEMANRSKNNEKIREEKPIVKKEEIELDMNEIKALPPPENYTPSPPPTKPQLKTELPKQETEDLVNLKGDTISTHENENKLALALFSGEAVMKTSNSWEAFSSELPEVTSAWDTPAAESRKPNWELALVESVSKLSRQKIQLAGGFDSLLLNGMYDQEAVKQYVSTTQLTGGSASSVALPGLGKNATQLLALPAPDGTVQPVGHQDPFAASLSVPPPSYVQVAEMEKKQRLLVQEQLLWEQYERNGMQGEKMANIGGVSSYFGLGHQPAMSYGMMPQVGGTGYPGGYYHAPY